MMRQLRDKRTIQVVIWSVIFAFVATIFFAWGMKFYGNQTDTRNLAAQVGETRITYTDFNKAYQPVSDRLYRSGQTPSPDEVKSLKTQVLDSLIDNTILEQEAHKLGLSVTDDEVIAAVQHEPYFLDEKGKFDVKKFNQLLQANQMTEVDFLAAQRQDKLMEKIRSILGESVLYTPQDLQDFDAFLNRELKADYISLNLESYQKNITVTDDKLKDYYESNKSQYDHPERAKIRHIFLAVQSESLQDQDKAKATLDDYRKQIVDGKAKFADLAMKNSQDTSSKNRGGEIGWVSRGNFPKEIEDVIFGLKKGEIAKPFKLQGGFDILQLEDHENAYKSTFADVRAKVLKQYQREKATEKIMTLAQTLAEKFKQNEPLAKAAQELSLTVHSTEWFNRKTGITGLKDSKSVADQLTSLHVKEWQGPVPVSGSEYFFQVTAEKPSKEGPQTADKIDVQVVQRLINERQSAWLKEFLEAQKKKLTIKSYLNS